MIVEFKDQAGNCFQKNSETRHMRGYCLPYIYIPPTSDWLLEQGYTNIVHTTLQFDCVVIGYICVVLCSSTPL